MNKNVENILRIIFVILSISYQIIYFSNNNIDFHIAGMLLLILGVMPWDIQKNKK